MNPAVKNASSIPADLAILGGPCLRDLPAQLASLAPALRDGREPGRFERAAKVTTLA